MRKRTGIFGGSFNPPHKGHVEICRYLLKKNDIDEIWVMPCFKHPFGKEIAPFDDRVMMCKFAFGEFGRNVHVSDAERLIGGISHTVKTIEYLQKNYPDRRFYLIIGSDTAGELETWKDADKIRSLVQIINIPRGPGSRIPDISSTNVRDAIASDKKFADLVPREVAVYIITHGLYD